MVAHELSDATEKIICYCLGPWYMNIVPSFFCADLGLQGRTAIFLKVSYF